LEICELLVYSFLCTVTFISPELNFHSRNFGLSSHFAKNIKKINKKSNAFLFRSYAIGKEIMIALIPYSKFGNNEIKN